MRFKEEVAHLIDIHPHVPAFLDALRASGRRVVLATNAHHKSVTLKMARTGLTPHFDAIVSSHAGRGQGGAGILAPCAKSSPSTRRARCWSTTACRCSTARAVTASRTW
jgi:FMN phosphatase YigB (HAD superfamily)